jgi:hypothetical protein
MNFTLRRTDNPVCFFHFALCALPFTLWLTVGERHRARIKIKAKGKVQKANFQRQHAGGFSGGTDTIVCATPQTGLSVLPLS